MEYRVTELEKRVTGMEKVLQEGITTNGKKIDELRSSMENQRFASQTANSSLWQNIILGPAISATISSGLIWFLLRVISPAGH
jgi:hypothetical protein